MKTRFLLIIIFAFFVTSCSFQDFNYTKIESGIEFTNNGVKKRVSFYDKNIVRVSLVKENQKFKDSSLVVILKPKKIQFSISEGSDLILKTDALILKINKKSGVISFLDSKNKTYLEEHNKVLSILRDTTIFDQSYYKVKQAFKLTKEEGLYGLGQFQDGVMNYRNKDILLVQANKIAIVPMLTSTNNYGILWDNYSKSTFHDSEDVTYFSSEVADQIDYYFIGDKSMDGVISGYRTLTGQAPMFSKKAFGYWQSKERYTSFDELHDVVKKYRDNNIPIDNIVQDWRYWGDNNNWSSMYFESEFFSNSTQNIKKLHSNNIDLMVSIWPSLGPNTQIFKEMNSRGFLLDQDHWCGGKIYDAYNPEARDLYWSHIKDGLMKNGVDALWMDGTEPELSNTDNQETTENEILKIGKTAIGPIAKYLNTYALVTSEAVYKNQREFSNDKRVFTLTRSSWAGQQRNATVTWSGDVSANFSNLKKQISAGLNFCMAGVPYWTHDIGAFFPSGRGGLYPKGIEDPAYQELYTRWFQFGAFSPIFRSHGTGTPREVWQFKDRNPEFYNALLKATHLRYQLLPYIYSTAWQITNNDYTLMRGLVMDFSQDKNTYSIKDQYMFGPSIMVKPITKSMYYDIAKTPPIISSKYLRTIDNKEGLNVTYFKGKDLKNEVFRGVDKEINYNWSGGGLPQGVPETNFSIRWEGKLVAGESGIHKIATLVDDGIRIWVDNKLIINQWKDQGATLYTSPINFEKGKEYAIKIEYFQGGGDAAVSLGWQVPSKKNETVVFSKNEDVYLPKHSGWYDFWTNEFYKGEQTITKEFPIDIFPVFIKAGSIIPYGPKQQYVNEKPNAPIELRIYAGENAEFEYYEDEGNNYNYELGKYNTIALKWDDSKKILKIGESLGTYKGYEKVKNFNIVLIQPNKKVERKMYYYSGDSTEIKF